MERFSEVALEFFVVGDSAGVGVGRGDVLGPVGDVVEGYCSSLVVVRVDWRKSVYSRFIKYADFAVPLSRFGKSRLAWRSREEGGGMALLIGS